MRAMAKNTGVAPVVQLFFFYLLHLNLLPATDSIRRVLILGYIE